MIVYKCKMCGGDLEIEDGKKMATCEYCMTKQSIPSTDDEKIASMYNRADHFRREKQFDVALGIYEHILEENPDDPETYWYLVLCKYGIEYVKDPVTQVQKPTIHGMQMKSILMDEDYRAALKHADANQRAYYEEQGNAIERYQREIIEIVNKEQAYDIFISYKDTMDGQRTQTSLLAQDLYETLTNAGYRVFYSRISLENILGEKYEPYIFAALSSAKVMLVVGRSREEFESPWVRNEWNRFLSMKSEREKKILIPCYKDMDPYDMPNEFQVLQCQDISKIGFEKDLLRGIQKILDRSKKKEERDDGKRMHATTDSLLERAFMCIQDGEYEKADSITDEVLNANPRDGKAYLGKLLIERKVPS